MKLNIEKECGKDQRQNRDQSAGLDPLTEGDVSDLLPLNHADGHDVSRAADHRQVSKESAAEQDSPPDGGDVHPGLRNVLDHGDENRNSKHIIHKTRQNTVRMPGEEKFRGAQRRVEISRRR